MSCQLLQINRKQQILCIQSSENLSFSFSMLYLPNTTRLHLHLAFPSWFSTIRMYSPLSWAMQMGIVRVQTPFVLLCQYRGLSEIATSSLYQDTRGMGEPRKAQLMVQSFPWCTEWSFSGNMKAGLTSGCTHGNGFMSKAKCSEGLFRWT